MTVPAGTGPTVARVLLDVLANPVERLLRRWNWKSAVLSSLSRASIFGAVNLSAGWEAAVAATTTELLFRGATSGFYGALTEAFRHARPTWKASLTAMVLLPLCSHTAEALVHWVGGTEKFVASLSVSALWTVLSTGFNLHAMRRGVLIVGEGRQSLIGDLRAIPALCWDLARELARGGGRLLGLVVGAAGLRMSRPPRYRPPASSSAPLA